MPTPLQQAIDSLKQLYDYGDNYGYLNCELSRIAECINRVSKFLPADRKAFEDCWDAGSHRASWEDNPMPPPPPTRDTYIDSLYKTKDNE